MTDFPTPTQVQKAKDYYDTLFRGRTYYSGMEPRHDEVLVAWCEKLEEELCDAYEDVMSECKVDSDGWCVTAALSHQVHAGDWLVAMGGWEKHPDGFGRVQRYRRLNLENDDD